jgi:hypothetical protein
MKNNLVLLLMLSFSLPALKIYGQIGHWLKDEVGLPCFEYTGKLPYEAYSPSGVKSGYSPDPKFMLGNYRFDLFTTVSGKYEIITNERVWGRLNQGKELESGECSASLDVKIKGKSSTFQLTGIPSQATNPDICTRVFGCGFANYTYKLENNIVVQRILSTKPSSTSTNGVPGFIITVKLKNNTAKSVQLTYNESVLANYTMLNQGRDNKVVQYKNSVLSNESQKTLIADIHAESNDPGLFPSVSGISKYDGYPPSFFFSIADLPVGAKYKLVPGNISEKENTLGASISFELKPGEEKEIHFVVGYSFDKTESEITSIINELKSGVTERAVKSNYFSGSYFRSDWKKILPDLKNEPDTVMKREMVWNAYCLEVIASYNRYYNETQIPQGTIYCYAWGANSAARDQCQDGLAACYTNPVLAKSNLRWLLKRQDAYGHIRYGERGFGMTTEYFFAASDIEIAFLDLFAEYLRITGDVDILLEDVEYYPMESNFKQTGLSHLAQAFRYIRDEVEIGEHGLVKLRNADWFDDMVLDMEKNGHPYSDIFFCAESNLNSIYVTYAIDNLIKVLAPLVNSPKFAKQKTQIESLIAGMNQYRNASYQAFMKDMEGRNFSRRALLHANTSYGDSILYLEPQAFMMLTPEVPIETKKLVWSEIQKRVMTGQTIGARQCEAGRNQFWYALNVPLLLGVAQFDKPKAWQMLKDMSFQNISSKYPEYWMGYWTAPDALSFSDKEGISGTTVPFCSHAHSWPIYGYFRLTELNKY